MTNDLSLPLGPAGFTNLDFLLSVLVEELRLPPRAVNAYQNEGIHYVGQLVQRSPFRFLSLPNFGKTSLQKTEEALALLGLAFGADIYGWSVERANFIRKEHLNSVRAFLAVKFGVFSPPYQSATDELDAILSALLEGRNREIAAKYWGFLGDEPRTLESVGQEYGMTRERVRQIAARAEDLARTMWLPTANCETLMRSVERQTPVALETAQRMIDERQAKGSLPVRSLLNAANIFGISSPLVIVKEGGAAFVDLQGRLPSIHEVAIDFRRATSRSGCVSIDRTSLRLTQDLEQRGTIQRVLDGLPETVWLDEDRSWASLVTERNRLSNTLRKILTVSDAVHISEMRQAALRSHRLSFVPPQAILSSFAEKIVNLIVRDGTVSRGASFEPVQLGEIEQVLFEGFQNLGSPLGREQLERYCIDQRGVNDNSFYVYLSYSPIVAKISPGIYGLVGAKIPLGTIEQLSVERKNDARSEHGWDKQGRLWFATRLSRLTIKMGMFYLPSFVVDLASGIWPARLPDGTVSGAIEVSDQGILGLRSILELSGAEPDDVMSLRFDFSQKNVEVEVGDDELFQPVTGSQAQALSAEHDWDDSDENEYATHPSL